MPPLLTKSLFKTGHECPTKLFYANKPDQYPDKKLADPFLAALAEGGFQVGELAKFAVCDDPVGAAITVTARQPETALQETQQRIARGDPVIAEAAVKLDDLFIRVDLFVIDQQAQTIDLIEVKAKSFDTDTRLVKRDATGQISAIPRPWEPYLMDVAFQKYVTCWAYPDYAVNAFLMLVDKTAVATVAGINQHFAVARDRQGSPRIRVDPALTRQALGDEILVTVNVDEAIDWLWDHPVSNDVWPGISFWDYLYSLAEGYVRDRKIPSPIGAKCHTCEFRASPAETAAGYRSGFKACWREQAGFTEADFSKPLIFDLWRGQMGARQVLQALLDKGTYFLADIEQADIAPTRITRTHGLSPFDRRQLQIEKARNKDNKPYIDIQGLRREYQGFVYPLHFIDFETSRVALPFHAGQHPYEGIAFQFSHHQVDADGRIRHQGQYLNAAPGVFPNFDFVRALHRELSQDHGTIFRYHHHENTYLCLIHDQLQATPIEACPDRDELMAFIRSISHRQGDQGAWCGARNMVDLYELVLRYYYSPAAGGSNSIKAILPAVIQESDFLQAKYSQPIYGRGKTIPSLNFDAQVWIDPEHDGNPYKTLPRLFADYDDQTLDETLGGISGIADGGAAMTAYAKLQFERLPRAQRRELEAGLLRYCELDTLAMVMIWEYWQQSI